METIEERAIQASEGYDDQAYSAGLYMGYIEGAHEQREIDIDKALKYLEEALQCGVHPCSKDSFIIGFKKAMEE